MEQRYNSFGQYMKEHFDAIVYKVNVDAGFTCPNRDGNLGVTGCIYCNNNSFRPNSCKPSMSVSEQVKNGITYLSKRYKAQKFIVYFQPYSNTYASVEELERLYNEALKEPSVMGLAIGTRPDCVDREKLELIESIAKKYFVIIEYGLQSIYDKTLEFVKRGHNYQAFLDTVDLTREKGILFGAHLMVGFPTETRDEMLAMADEISIVKPDFLKVHQLQIIKDTILADIYNKNPFYAFSYEEYRDFVVDFVERLSPKIVLQRLFATAPDNILIAPKWDKSRYEVTNGLMQKFIERNTFQGKKFVDSAQKITV